MKHYELHCSCDEHAQNLYFNWPYSCQIKHSKDDIVVEAGARPTLVSEFGNGPYEALTLAYRTIEYFTREEKNMDPQQLDAVNRFRLCSECSRVLDMLSLDDIRSDETDALTQWLFEHLKDIFFFGALKKPSILWTAELDSTILGDTNTGLSDGHELCNIRLHPTLRGQIRSEFIRKGQSLAEERFRTILHELLHGFLMQYACHQCHVDNHCCHGRAWQRIAKAIEEESLRLLDVEVDFDRLGSLLCDRDSNTHQDQSIHDVRPGVSWRGCVAVYGVRASRVPRVLSCCSFLTSMSTFYPFQHQRYVM
jgi:hypothetical protein